MKQRFTPNHLIQYLYNETSVSETLAIDEALNEDVKLAEEFECLCQGYRQLPKVTFRPTSDAVQNILRYSERTAMEKHA